MLFRRIASQAGNPRLRGDKAEHASAAVETSVNGEDVAVRIEAEEVSECLYGDDGAGRGFLLGHPFPEKYLQKREHHAAIK